MDALANSKRIKRLTIIDDSTRECLSIAVDFGISGEYITHAPDRIGRFRGLHGAIQIDQRLEFTSWALDRWAYGQAIILKLTVIYTPTQNVYIESLNGKSQDEWLSDHYFSNLTQARVEIEAWRCDYNEAGPHSWSRRTPSAELALRHRLRAGDGETWEII